MSVANMTVEKTTDFGKIIGKTLIALWIGFIAFGESAGRARAAAELSRQGFHEEAKRLMLDRKS
jgi:hypothetical protein|tara:strand:+ start:2459 stop:2650 length:192 start_codon:yes stop_codon:yes gene_type:complete